MNSFRATRAVLFVALSTLIAAAVQAAPARPNLLLILSDDQGYGDTGATGCKDFATPHLDSIARNGIRCTSGYASAPQCAPSRCGLLTGRYQNRFGYEFNNDSPGVGLPLTEVTLADRLKAAGYLTGAVGKWHLGKEAPFHPLQRGFTEFYGFLGGGHVYLAPESKAARQPARPDLWRNREPVPHTKYLTDHFGDEAAAFVGRHAGSPWFLYLAFNAPHSPLQATPEYLARVAGITNATRRTYAAMVTAMDDNIGRVLAKLRATGQEERTLVVFLSDNGGPLGNAWNGSDNAPFSGQKGDTLEGGIRVPFFAQWKGVLPAGKVFAAPVISLDLAPTLLAAAGVTPPAEAKLDGMNLLPAWKGQAALPERALFWRFNFPPGREELYKNAIREGDWKLVKSWERAAGGQRSAGTPKLIDLSKDITETSDQSAAQPDRAAALRGQWERWNRELAEPFGGQERVKERRGKKPRPTPAP
jgi:arylsulfatase A-like enzyme